ncbi:hypothetical protein D9758_018001 [Tetrapyrgos nigripes]|uniref:3'-5' exonuclease n=1 Tax=Tetrapyrgos nigripes TaxID=182062 RepID=A0A8H5F9X2_9AGAR|nr:hypothetical protein D9758_018001 [Tetrapyrgos nigripes]
MHLEPVQLPPDTRLEALTLLSVHPQASSSCSRPPTSSIPQPAHTSSSHHVVDRVCALVAEDDQASGSFTIPDLDSILDSFSHGIDIVDNNCNEGPEPLMGEGLGIGDDERCGDEDPWGENNDEDDDEDNKNATTSRKKSHCPYPPWFQYPLDKTLQQLKSDHRSMMGHSHLHLSGAFWFPQKLTWFLLDKAESFSDRSILSPVLSLGSPGYRRHLDWLPKLQCISYKVAAVGFDTEWNVNVSESGHVQGHGPTSIIQIALKDDMYVLKLGEKLPQQLVLFLQDQRILKVRRMVSGDLQHLETISGQGPFHGAVELGSFAKQHFLIQDARISLADLTAALLGKCLPKNCTEHISAVWSIEELNPVQLSYAATDAYAGLLLFDKINSVPSGVPFDAVCLWTHVCLGINFPSLPLILPQSPTSLATSQDHIPDAVLQELLNSAADDNGEDGLGSLMQSGEISESSTGQAERDDESRTWKAILPIHTIAEHKLFNDLMSSNKFYINSKKELSNEAVWIWNHKAEEQDDIFYKLSEYLLHYANSDTPYKIRI